MTHKQYTHNNGQTPMYLQGSLQWADQHSQFCLMTTPDRKTKTQLLWLCRSMYQLVKVHRSQRNTHFSWIRICLGLKTNRHSTSVLIPSVKQFHIYRSSIIWRHMTQSKCPLLSRSSVSKHPDMIFIFCSPDGILYDIVNITGS